MTIRYETEQELIEHMELMENILKLQNIKTRNVELASSVNAQSLIESDPVKRQLLQEEFTRLDNVIWRDHEKLKSMRKRYSGE